MSSIFVNKLYKHSQTPMQHLFSSLSENKIFVPELKQWFKRNEDKLPNNIYDKLYVSYTLTCSECKISYAFETKEIGKNNFVFIDGVSNDFCEPICNKCVGKIIAEIYLKESEFIESASESFNKRRKKMTK